MNATPDWGRVKEVFQRAIDIAAVDRSAFLAEACGGDAALRLEVESLLAAHDDTGHLLETSAPGGASGPLRIAAGDPPLEDELEVGASVPIASSSGSAPAAWAPSTSPSAPTPPSTSRSPSR